MIVVEGIRFGIVSAVLPRVRYFSKQFRHFLIRKVATTTMIINPTVPHPTVSSGDTGKISAKTYDIEAWMAGQNAYRELVSCSNCLDFQARRLGIRFRDKTNEDTRFVHTLNSTLVASERTMVGILEYYQSANGTVEVPEVLQKYLGGLKEIKNSS